MLLAPPPKKVIFFVERYFSVTIECVSKFISRLAFLKAYAVKQLVLALPYKPTGCGFEFRWGP